MPNPRRIRVRNKRKRLKADKARKIDRVWSEVDAIFDELAETPINSAFQAYEYFSQIKIFDGK